MIKLEMKPAKPSQGEAQAGLEGTAEEWRFYDEAQAHSSKVSRSCNLTASQNPSSLNSFTCSS